MYCPNCGKRYNSATTYFKCPMCGVRLHNSITDAGEEHPTSTYAMEGDVSTFDWNTGRGVISGSDGNRYQFTRQEWRSQIGPRPKVRVNFRPDGTYARDISVFRPSSLNAESTPSQLSNHIPHDGEERPTPTYAMEGDVSTFDWNTGRGVISGSDGNRYQFTRREWHSQIGPRPMVRVNFRPDGTYAQGISVFRPSSLNAESTPSQLSNHIPQIGPRPNDANQWLDFFLGFALGFIGLGIMLMRMRTNELRWEWFGAGWIINVALAVVTFLWTIDSGY